MHRRLPLPRGFTCPAALEAGNAELVLDLRDGIVMSHYPPMRDYAMLGNCRSAALVSKSGAIDWLCLPRFDSPALLCRMLDWSQGPFLQVAPAEAFSASRAYLPDSMVLKTCMDCSRGRIELTDFMPISTDAEDNGRAAAAGAVFRLIEGKDAPVEVAIRYKPGFDFAQARAVVETSDAGCLATSESGEEWALLQAPVRLERQERGEYVGRLTVHPGERRWIVLSWSQHDRPTGSEPAACEAKLDSCLRYWRSWIGRCAYEGPYVEQVRRSALILKSLIYQPTGALIAAPTTSLPERFGGDLNWDFRYCWLRDAGLTVDVLQLLGYHDESIAFLNWLERLSHESGERLQPLYRVDGDPRLPEAELPHLEGYRECRPVRIGNAAAEGFQLDAFGYVIEAAALCYLRMPREMSPSLWSALKTLADKAVELHRSPDSGIWEDRGPPRQYLHSKVYCWIALESMLKLAQRFKLDGDVDRWTSVRDEIRDTILSDGFDADTQSFRQILGEPGVDASSLVVALSGLLPATDPRFLSTLDRVRRELSVKGLVTRRRKPDLEEPDDGAFILCNYWVVDSLLLVGRREEAEALYQRLLDLRNDVGILPEEVDPGTDAWLGAFPIGFSHLAQIRSAIALSEQGSPGSKA